MQSAIQESVLTKRNKMNNIVVGFKIQYKEYNDINFILGMYDNDNDNDNDNILLI